MRVSSVVRKLLFQPPSHLWLGVRLDALREVFETVQQTRQTLMYLKMKNNHMTAFPAHLLSRIDIRHLMAHKCGIETVDQAAFAGHEEGLETIDFSDNKFSQVNKKQQQISILAII